MNDNIRNIINGEKDGKAKGQTEVAKKMPKQVNGYRRRNGKQVPYDFDVLGTLGQVWRFFCFNFRVPLRV